ncbi:MAG: hypothetical protein ACKVT1_13560 [Dehalococcoidia bacterium]
MQRRWTGRKVLVTESADGGVASHRPEADTASPASGPASAPAEQLFAAESALPAAAQADPEAPAALPAAPRRYTKKRLALGIAATFLVVLAGAYSQKDHYSHRMADWSRDVIGDKNTSRVEAFYFTVQDKVDQLKYRVFGGDTNPFDSGRVYVQAIEVQPPRRVLIDLSKPIDLNNLHVPELFKPRQMEPPATKPLRDNLEQGEGVWTTAGLPRSAPGDMLMAKTFVRPDKTRPYATVGVLLLDARRIRLQVVGGTVDPGGDRGVKGPGIVAPDDLKRLLVAFTGGFKGPHGGFGMVAEGKEYRPLRNGLASIAIFNDGTIKMGEWGKSLAWDENMAAVRQNAILLVDNCEVSKRTAEGNDTWGYVVANSQEFITWRSAVGLTKDGNLVVAAGNHLSAATLASALWAAGACTAMQLDINSPYVLTSLYFPQGDGTMKAEKFMDSMPANPNRYATAQERDFFYVTLDESRFR